MKKIKRVSDNNLKKIFTFTGIYSNPTICESWKNFWKKSRIQNSIDMRFWSRKKCQSYIYLNLLNTIN